MTDIKRLVKSIGKIDFVGWLEECVKHPNGQDMIIKKMHKTQPKLKLNSCGIKINCIYRIIDENLIDEACDEVINSTRKDITNDMKLKAKKLKKYA